MSFDFRITNGDITIGSDGDLQKIENTAKLIQDILLIITTPIGSNQFYPWYGSPISKSMIGQAFDMEFSSTVASSQVQNALEILQKLQQEQARQQRVTPFEQLAAVKQVKIERNNIDPRFFLLIVEVLTKALTETSVQTSIKPSL